MNARLILSGVFLLAAIAAPAAPAQQPRYPPGEGCAEFNVRTPDMRGQTVAAMRERYAAFTYRVTGRTYTDKYPRGQIVSQRPAPNTCVQYNATLDVTVSRGPRCYRVPAVSQDDLERRFVAMGPRQARVPLRTRNADSDRPRGSILSQTPRAGSCPRELPEFIAVEISRGPPPCFDVPRVTPADAERGFVLAGNRWRVPVDVSREYSDRYREGEVIRQEPKAGACVESLIGILAVLAAGPQPVPPPPPEQGGGALEGVSDFVADYWPGILAVLAGLVLLGVAGPGKTPPPPDPARFAVRPRIDPGTQTATVPASVEGGRPDV